MQVGSKNDENSWRTRWQNWVAVHLMQYSLEFDVNNTELT